MPNRTLRGEPQGHEVGLIPVAYTIGTDFRPAKRQPLDTVLHWEGW
jgi:hypothetical protein